MALQVRPAQPSDVPAVAALSATLRRRLEEWGGSRWWRRAPGADEIHPMWLGHLVTAAGTGFRVVTDGDDVVAAAVAPRRRPRRRRCTTRAAPWPWSTG